MTTLSQPASCIMSATAFAASRCAGERNSRWIWPGTSVKRLNASMRDMAREPAEPGKEGLERVVLMSRT